MNPLKRVKAVRCSCGWEDRTVRTERQAVQAAERHRCDPRTVNARYVRKLASGEAR